MSRKCDEYYQPDNCINTGTPSELMCQECLIAELPRLRTENAALTLALAESLRNRTTEASWMVRLRDAEARAEKMKAVFDQARREWVVGHYSADERIAAVEVIKTMDARARIDAHSAAPASDIVKKDCTVPEYHGAHTIDCHVPAALTTPTTPQQDKI